MTFGLLVFPIFWESNIQTPSFVDSESECRTPSFSDIGSPTFGLLDTAILKTKSPELRSRRPNLKY